MPAEETSIATRREFIPLDSVPAAGAGAGAAAAAATDAAATVVPAVVLGADAWRDRVTLFDDEV